MENSLLQISLLRLAIIFVPVFIVIAIQFRWAMKPTNILYAIGRMLAQLLLIGYLLTFIFESNDYRLVLTVLSIMIFFSGWIALRTIPEQRKTFIGYALLSILSGGGLTLFIVSQGVLSLDPWYMPRYLIPLAGMIFANAMNCVSLAADRLKSELLNNQSYEKARNTAFRTALIPILNAFFAVGLVSLPGMMTGQILSGVDPLLAARYQIMVMCMIFSSAGISTIIFLSLVKMKEGVFVNTEEIKL